jgi:magnesium transporter
MIAIYHKSIKDGGLRTLESFQSGSWIYAENPTVEELDKLAADFSLERDLLEDAKDLQEVPRQEIENDVIYIFTRIPYEDHLTSATIPILFVLGRDFVITITQQRPSFVEKFILGQVNFNTNQKTRLFIQLFHQINVEYNRSINSINRQVRGMHIQFQNITNEDIVRFVTFENALNDFLAALVPTSNILKDLLSGKHLKLHEKDGELVEDLFLANGQLIEICRSTLKNIFNIRNAYSTIMTNDLNRVIKLLTALTIILSVPTIIASIYGMNVVLPLAENNQAFWLIGGGTIISVFVLFLLFKKNRWL